MVKAMIIGFGLAAAVQAAAAEELTQMIRAAAAEGSAEGVVTGKLAAFWQSGTKSDSPVYARITTIKTFSQPDCRRLNISIGQENVPTKTGEKLVYRQDFQMNVCSDGTPPKESVEAWEKQQSATKKKK